MKQIKCIKCNGLMQRMYMRNNKGWHISKYWMCPSCQIPYIEEMEVPDTKEISVNIEKVEVDNVEMDDESTNCVIKLDSNSFERFLRRKKTPDETDVATINRILDGDIKLQPR